MHRLLKNYKKEYSKVCILPVKAIGNNPSDHLIWPLGKHIVRQMFLRRRFTEKSLGTNSVGEVRKHQ